MIFLLIDLTVQRFILANISRLYISILYMYRALQVRIEKDLFCICGFLSRLCSTVIRFGAAIDLEMHCHGDIHHSYSSMLLASDK